MNETNIVHVRNLDFDFPKDMQKLIYNQRFVKGDSNETIAIAPSIAGFFGIYTAMKPNSYSLSYNVRFAANHTMDHRSEDIWTNLNLELDPEYMPFQNLMLNVVTGDADYHEAVQILS
jgi:hypothetical protein